MQNKTGCESSEICSSSTQNHFLTNFLPVWAFKVRVQIRTDLQSDQKPETLLSIHKADTLDNKLYSFLMYLYHPKNINLCLSLYNKSAIKNRRITCDFWLP